MFEFDSGEFLEVVGHVLRVPEASLCLERSVESCLGVVDALLGAVDGGEEALGDGGLVVVRCDSGLVDDGRERDACSCRGRRLASIAVPRTLPRRSRQEIVVLKPSPEPLEAFECFAGSTEVDQGVDHRERDRGEVAVFAGDQVAAIQLLHRVEAADARPCATSTNAACACTSAWELSVVNPAVMRSMSTTARCTAS